jgi:tRNA (guanine9-N1)-methyltransferase
VVETTTTTPLLSKNRQKKLQKLQRNAQAKKERKAKDREARRAKALAEGRDLDAEERLRLERTQVGDSKRRRQEHWDTNMLPLATASFQICLDCSFESKMTDKEIASLASQIRYCYAYNKKSKIPSLWVATSLNGSTLGLLQKETGFTEWSNRAFVGTSESLPEYYQDHLEKVVYLTSDSDHTITTLEHDKIYVIGGIVDRNRLTRAAMDCAEALGVATARLPLDEHLAKMPATPVLTCNHVFDILLKYKEHDGDWGKALQEVLPVRKEAGFKAKSESKNKSASGVARDD